MRKKSWGWDEICHVTLYYMYIYVYLFPDDLTLSLFRQVGSDCRYWPI